jgi:hypothetical protein
MGANRAGKNLRAKQKRHLKNIRTFEAALEKRAHAVKPTRRVKVAKAE